ncbi:phosphatidate cytidylyltransferase [Caldimonas aquatica]|uniref:Phosphatidate cytidylyltransferase n=1 Tax=Caldimonas aquatica TaxID=376175 RepID=A0ABY6MML9_9BURK|nr:phosphatidate cytidylyltransferase [Schlegelella aquatica]UZD53749.1 phosphatidate cytidylyltransferase [Schlegelella aquatica]
MLKQRVITALVLLAILLPALLVPQVWPFALLSLAAVGAAAWEWGRLNGLSPGGSLGLGAAVVLACGLSWNATTVLGSTPALWWGAAGGWVVGGALLLRGGPTGWPRLAQPVRLAIGAVVLWLTWIAMTQAKAEGLNFLLSVFCLVWAADIAAYFGGRAFGRRKLAPTISPGKSWEGVWSGMAGVLALAVVWTFIERSTGGGIEPSLYSRLYERAGWGGFVVACAFLVSMSVVGDLFESLVKRSVGAKDSSGLLPGHGGVLDRIDALLPVFPIAWTLSRL